MIEIDARNATRRWRDHIRRIQFPTEPDFYHGNFHPRAGKPQETGCGDDLKKGGFKTVKQRPMRF